MGRQGFTALELVVGFIVVFAGLVIVLLFLNSSSRSFLDSLSCDEQGDSGLIQMPKHEGCLKSNQHASYMLGFFGTDKGYVCCEITDYDPKISTTWDLDLRRTPPVDTPTGGVAVQGLTMTSALTNKALADGATVAVYASSSKTPNTISISAAVSCPKDTDCSSQIKCEEKLTTVTGKDVTAELFGENGACKNWKITQNPAGTAKALASTIKIEPKPEYADQTLLYTLRILKDGLELDTYTLKFRISSPVKYAGLSQTWAKRKEITAACESPVTCSDILFQTVPKPKLNEVPSCPVDVKPETAEELKTQYCVVKDGQLTDTCGVSLNACTQGLLSMNDVEYSGLHTALLAAVNKGIIQDNFALQFATAQGEKSTYSCIKSTNKIEARTAGSGTLYRVPVDPTTGRATFTLEHKSFEGAYVCVYGRDKTDPSTVYAGKGPVKVALDVTPPIAHLEFKPGSLQLRFGCTDQAEDGTADPELVSGCKDTFGTAYISQTAPFLASLVSKDTPQNAAAWCPPYANAGGYGFEARAITQYTGNEVRVMCLRVEDKAGNAGVAMTTVYNTYDILLNALAGAVNEAHS